MGGYRDFAVVADYVTPNKLRGLRQVLALTCGAMLACDEAGVRYSVPDDFYPYGQFRKDFLRQVSKLENALNSMRGTSLAYADNIYWFICYHGNYVYLSKLISRMKKDGVRATSIICSHYQPFPEKKRMLSFESLNFGQFSFGLSNKISILQELTGAIILQCGGKGKGRRLVSFSDIKKYLTQLKLPGRGKGRGNIWVVQGGYEVSLLERYLPEFNFIDIMKEVGRIDFPRAPKDSLLDYSTYPSAISLFGAPLKKLFAIYYEDIIRRLPAYEAHCERKFIQDKPRALFFSVGANKAHEALLVRMANRKGVPVFYFQHGGGGTFGFSPLHKYIEDSRGAKVIKIEREQFGSIALFNLRKSFQEKPTKDVLYCAGPPPFHVYKDLLHNCSESWSYKAHREIIETVSKCGLQLDIQVHPQEQECMKGYFMRLPKPGTVKVLWKQPAESILKNYRLIIIDYLTSALTPAVLMTRVPVICYTEDVEGIANPTILVELKKRVQFVGDPDSLWRALKEVVGREVASEEFTKKYILPLGNIDPGQVMADYVQMQIRGYEEGKRWIRN
ncbi:MAG: hypothetical protein DRG39_07885 [Deltaproteobacteria bacterium]|nr:MAG: hypothetical protein DRG39_07885 [Deltaproteobacteria bacterium]